MSRKLYTELSLGEWYHSVRGWIEGTEDCQGTSFKGKEISPLEILITSGLPPKDKRIDEE